MSWEHNHYKAICRACGHEGECIRSSDDWNRCETTYPGFITAAPSATEAGRKRAAPNDQRPRCPQCDSADIEVGEYIKTT